MFTYLIRPSVQNFFLQRQKKRTCFKFQAKQVLVQRGSNWPILAQQVLQIQVLTRGFLLHLPIGIRSWPSITKKNLTGYYYFIIRLRALFGDFFFIVEVFIGTIGFTYQSPINNIHSHMDDHSSGQTTDTTEFTNQPPTTVFLKTTLTWTIKGTVIRPGFQTVS